MNSSPASRVFVASLFGLLFSTSSLLAQINQWTKPSSGNWEEPFWSLGLLPADDQSVAITNAGFKAVAIGPQTWRQFPGSLIVSNLWINGPSNSLNTLLLNYVFTEVPLRILNRLHVGTNGVLINLHSAILMTNDAALVVEGGRVHQEGGLTSISNARLDGEYAGVGAAMNFNRMQVGVLSPGGFHQTGGTTTVNQVTLSDYLGSFSDPYSGGYPASCNLTNGLIIASDILIGYANQAEWNQHGGEVQTTDLRLGRRLGNMFSGAGIYRLYAGNVRSSTLTLGDSGGDGTFLQEGGTNTVGLLTMGVGNSFFGGGYGAYTLSNGALYAGSVSMGWVDGSSFLQAGGIHYITNGLSLNGRLGLFRFDLHYASYTLEAGSLEAESLQMTFPTFFSQQGGTAHFRGTVQIDGEDYITSPTSLTVAGGHFSCANLNARDCNVSAPGGTIIVSNLLSIAGRSEFCPCTPPGGYAKLHLTGGSLAARDIEIAALMQIDGSKPWRVKNSGSIKLLDGGFLILGNNAQERLGHLVVDGHSTLRLGNTNFLQFSDSHLNQWKVGARLTITNWNGSTNGAGSTQVLFGNGLSALSQSQLRQIQFANPTGFPSGLYDAEILSTGEIVPTSRPILHVSASSTNYVLSWKSADILQTATNVEGPFQDLQGAASPYTNQPGPSPRRFYRLKR